MAPHNELLVSWVPRLKVKLSFGSFGFPLLINMGLQSWRSKGAIVQTPNIPFLSSRRVPYRIPYTHLFKESKLLLT